MDQFPAKLIAADIDLGGKPHEPAPEEQPQIRETRLPDTEPALKRLNFRLVGSRKHRSSSEASDGSSTDSSVGTDDGDGDADDDDDESDIEQPTRADSGLSPEVLGSLPPPCIVQYSYAFASRQGKRPTMEDEHVIIPKLHPIGADGKEISQISYSYFAVFDGHGGPDASKFAAQHMHKYLAQELGTRGRNRYSIKEAIQAAFDRLDRDFISLYNARKGTEEALHGGSTAIVGLIVGRILYIAGTGDSRAVLCGADGSAATLSRDHKPLHIDEFARIQAEGGFVRRARVLGSLAMSRALGDAKYKDDGVIATPDVFRYRLAPEAIALVLACDGLWDFVPQSTVAETVAKLLKAKDSNVEAIAVKLVNDAIDKYEGTDNCTVVLVAFDWDSTLRELQRAGIQLPYTTPQGPLSAPVPTAAPTGG